MTQRQLPFDENTTLDSEKLVAIRDFVQTYPEELERVGRALVSHMPDLDTPHQLYFCLFFTERQYVVPEFLLGPIAASPNGDRTLMAIGGMLGRQPENFLAALQWTGAIRNRRNARHQYLEYAARYALIDYMSWDPNEEDTKISAKRLMALLEVAPDLQFSPHPADRHMSWWGAIVRLCQVDAFDEKSVAKTMDLLLSYNININAGHSQALKLALGRHPQEPMRRNDIVSMLLARGAEWEGIKLTKWAKNFITAHPAYRVRELGKVSKKPTPTTEQAIHTPCF